MKKLLTLSVCLLISFGGMAKGGSGTYIITGIANDSLGQPLVHTEIFMQYHGDRMAVQTDENGHYIFIVPWYGSCASGSTKKQRLKQEEAMNPKWIYAIYNKQYVKIENQWKKYAKMFPKKQEEITRRLNLKFESKTN